MGAGLEKVPVRLEKRDRPMGRADAALATSNLGQPLPLWGLCRSPQPGWGGITAPQGVPVHSRQKRLCT